MPVFFHQNSADRLGSCPRLPSSRNPLVPPRSTTLHCLIRPILDRPPCELRAPLSTNEIDGAGFHPGEQARFGVTALGYPSRS